MITSINDCEVHIIQVSVSSHTSPLRSLFLCLVQHWDTNKITLCAGLVCLRTPREADLQQEAGKKLKLLVADRKADEKGKKTL